MQQRQSAMHAPRTSLLSALDYRVLLRVRASNNLHWALQSSSRLVSFRVYSGRTGRSLLLFTAGRRTLLCACQCDSLLPTKLPTGVHVPMARAAIVAFQSLGTFERQSSTSSSSGLKRITSSSPFEAIRSTRSRDNKQPVTHCYRACLKGTSQRAAIHGGPGGGPFIRTINLNDATPLPP